MNNKRLLFGIFTIITFLILPTVIFLSDDIQNRIKTALGQVVQQPVLLYNASSPTYSWTLVPPYDPLVRAQDQGQTFTGNRNPFFQMYACGNLPGYVAEVKKFLDVCIPQASVINGNKWWSSNASHAGAPCTWMQKSVDAPPQSTDNRSLNGTGQPNRSIQVCTDSAGTKAPNPFLNISTNFNYTSSLCSGGNAVVLAGRSDPFGTECQGLNIVDMYNNPRNYTAAQHTCTLFVDDLVEVQACKGTCNTFTFRPWTGPWGSPMPDNYKDVCSIFNQGDGAYTVNVKAWDEYNYTYGSGDMWLTWLNYAPNRISGNVYVDTNANGTKDAGEIGYQGATITLSGASTGTNTSDASGNYQFTFSQAGSVTATITVPANHRNTTPTSRTVTVPPNQTVNFGIIPAFDITGEVFVDTNTNGIKDGSEVGYAGATVQLSGAATASRTTNGTGGYSFPNQNSGSYTLALTVPSGYRATNANSVNFNLTADRVIRFGIVQSTTTPIAGQCTSQSLDIMIIIDHSGTMGNADPSTGLPKLTEAKNAANQFIDALAQNVPTSQVGAVQLAGSTDFPNRPNMTGVVSPLSNNFAQAKTNISSIGQSGGTCFECAIVLANNELSARGRAGVQKMVIFLTDGRTNQTIASNGINVTFSEAENAAMNAITNGVNSQNISYYTIGIGSTTAIFNEPFLIQIAQSNGGIYFNNPDNGDMYDIFDAIADSVIGSATLTGTLFNDLNGNGLRDAGDGPLANWTVELTGGPLTTPVTAVTNASGVYTLTANCNDTYTVREVVQAGWSPSTVSSYTLSVASGNTYSNLNFGNRLGYRITGNVFNDVNKNGLKDASEQNYTGGINITASSGTVVENPNGSYVVDVLSGGTFTISYTSSLPTGFTLVNPRNGPPPSYSVTVGSPCSTNGAPGAVCSATGISNLNFAISNSLPWLQVFDLDIRVDEGVTNWVSPLSSSPPYTNANSSAATNPGIIFSGDGTTDFGLGQSSSTRWVVGGTVYPEEYVPSGTKLRTSYANMLAVTNQIGVAPVDLATVCTISNCTLPANLPNGVYIADDDVILNAFTFPADRNYVFLINGTLEVRGNIRVPVGSTALFTASRDIIIDSSVGAATNSYPLPTGQIQGFYSADRNFIIDGTNDCLVGADRMLNVEGAIIVNAGRVDGRFINDRDLCGNNLSYPSLTISGRADFLLNSPEFIKKPNTSQVEVAP